ncbi:hypothetical protein CONLIGDRAFT_706645 [Coniochaeta ligniaria NRRL 30616]|uniref:Integral membrane protein n=1 Tax=Coniochaeta ligniaria NRRL 30616 TaxID=1408157 RepID=A0A1J7IZ91_9PEZI|nr:hypothetical protein CONLIGDRAFT_706645 [Coniochaeta ligniaria NRRL 30616]
MKSIATSALAVLASVAVLGLVPAALAHGDEDMNMDMGMGANSTADQPLPEDSYPLTYFALDEHTAAIYGHIALMVIAWVFMLPVAIMLSLVRSRYTLIVQFVFIAANAFGILLGVIYNANTPDLYPNNAHHKLGWIVTWVVLAQVVIGLLGRVAGVLKGGPGSERLSREHQSFIPVSSEAMEEHDSHFGIPKFFRHSNDSGHGTEPGSESLRNSSSSSGANSPPIRDASKEYVEDEDIDLEDHDPLPASTGNAGAYRALAGKVAGMVSSRAWKFLIFGYNFVDRTILILGFITLTTGIVTFGRFFEGPGIFNGLAHWIKGGVFFWYGILTLGRWAGCFGEIGWAWNVRPRSVGQKWRPSAEFVESALIFFYGSTNVFLEHLGNWGGEYSATDLEHISITVLFIGGGLCGMLIESTRIRDLLNSTVTEAAHAYPEHSYHDSERDALRQPDTYEFSINPIPALVILLLGIMMSSHTQASMISSMVHKQWGNLLTGASFARGFTYVIVYLKPPKSILPSRPPTELLTAFGLIAGGVIFMASSGDTVSGMIHYQLDAMFMYTVTMGLVGLLMAWEILCIALKGWALRKEAGRPLGSYRMA